MTGLHQLRAEIERLRQENIRFHSQKEELERAWSPDVKTTIPSIKEQLMRNFQRIAEAEAEEHRITWPRLRSKP